MKDFWNKFTTRFAVPVLIVTQVITLYDGWESRVNERAYQQELLECVRQHFHYTEEDTMVTLPDGTKMTSAEFFDDGYDETGEVYWEKDTCRMFRLQSPIEHYTPQRIADRWLGKIFWTYKNNKDRFLAWIDYWFMRKATEDIRG